MNLKEFKALLEAYPEDRTNVTIGTPVGTGGWEIADKLRVYEDEDVQIQLELMRDI